MDNFFNIEKLITKFAADMPSSNSVTKEDKLSSGINTNLKR